MHFTFIVTRHLSAQDECRVNSLFLGSPVEGVPLSALLAASEASLSLLAVNIVVNGGRVRMCSVGTIASTNDVLE